ncbi:MAG: hypothetical protein JJV97_06170 [SAR324 cluster bacterium]|nr:hypothetical protein [SAR324 cluster bacterium]
MPEQTNQRKIYNSQDIPPDLFPWPAVVEYRLLPGDRMCYLPFKVKDKAELYIYLDGQLLNEEKYRFRSVASASIRTPSILLITPLTKEAIIRVVFKTKLRREFSIQDYGNYSSNILNYEFNKIYSILDQFDYRMKRSISLPISEDQEADYLLNTDKRKSNLLGFDSDGKPKVYPKYPDKLSNDLGEAPGYSIRSWAIFDGHNIRIISTRNIRRIRKISVGHYKAYLTRALANPEMIIQVSGTEPLLSSFQICDTRTVSFKTWGFSSTGQRVLYDDPRVQLIIVG